METAVRVKNLTKQFPGVTALKNVSLEVPRGTVFAVLGPNGSGKTTLLKILLGLLQPTAGSGTCLGQDIVAKSLEVRQNTSYIGEAAQFYEYMRVEEFIRFCRGLYPRWNEELLQKYMAFFHIPPGEKIKNLSHGMKSQLALLIALAPEPELLLLDEPTAGCDPIFRRQFNDTVLVETIGKGKTVVIASHLLNDVEKVADRVAFLHCGEVLTCCPMDVLKNNIKEIRAVFKTEPPLSLFEMKGITRVERRGNSFQINICDNLDEILQTCRNIPHFSMDVLDQSLEDIFVSLLNAKEKEGAKNDQ